MALPAAWRAALAEAGGYGEPEGLYAFIHPAGAVAVVPLSLKRALFDGVAGWVDRRSSELLLIIREEITYSGADIRPDPQGRVVIPQLLCEYAAVAQEPRDEMTWVGKGHYAELWRRERRMDRVRTGRYGAPQGCEWDRDDARELAATFEETMGRIAGAST